MEARVEFENDFVCETDFGTRLALRSEIGTAGFTKNNPPRVLCAGCAKQELGCL